MKRGQLGDAEPVPAAVLRTVGEHRAIGTDRRRDPAPPAHPCTRELREFHAPAHQLGGAAGTDPAGGEAFEAGLVAGRGSDFGPGAEEGLVCGNGLAASVEQEAKLRGAQQIAGDVLHQDTKLRLCLGFLGHP